MSKQLMRIVLQRAQNPQRALSTSSNLRADIAIETVKRQEVAIETPKDRIHPKLGNRDIVGYGFNGSATYADRQEYPCPAVRFKENTPEILQLRVKEKGDWRCLSLAEKKALYRASFAQTYAEMNAPTGEWKSILAAVLTALAVTGWVIIYMKKFVYSDMPHTITRQWQEDSLDRMLAQGQGRIEGISSKYDFEKGTWK